MRARNLYDKVWRGLGTAARMTGETTDAYRPTDAGDPLRPANRFLRLPTLITRPRLGAARGGGHGEVFWEGTFDAAYTRPGDYLVRPDGAIWFVAVQSAMQAPLCVRALRRLSFLRPSGSISTGMTSYGGVVRDATSGLLTSWPAAMVPIGNAGQIELATTTPLQQPKWSVLLPPCEWLGLLPGDKMSDDLGRSGVVEAAEYTDQGWRLMVREATF